MADPANNDTLRVTDARAAELAARERLRDAMLGYTTPVADLLADRALLLRLLDECAVALQLCAPLECPDNTDDADCGCTYHRVNPVRERLREVSGG